MLKDFTQIQPFMRANYEVVPEPGAPKGPEEEALQRNVLTVFQQIVGSSPTLSDELGTVAITLKSQAGWWISFRRRCPSLSPARSRKSWRPRTSRPSGEAGTSTWVKSGSPATGATRSRSEVQDRGLANQREYYLREQMKPIQKELGRAGRDPARREDAAGRR